MKPVFKRMFLTTLSLILLLFLLNFGKEAMAVNAICSQIIVGCLRSGSYENFMVYSNGYWYGEGFENNVVYVDPNTEFTIALYAAGGYGPYVYVLSTPEETPIEKTGFDYYSLFNVPQGVEGQYAAQVDFDSGKIFRIAFKISDTRNSSSSERSLFASSPPTLATSGEKYVYEPVLAESIVAGNPVTWYLSVSPQGMQLDDYRGKITWLPTEQQVGFHDASLLAAVDDGDKSITEEQKWTITVSESPSKNKSGVCFILALFPEY